MSYPMNAMIGEVTVMGRGTLRDDGSIRGVLTMDREPGWKEIDNLLVAIKQLGVLTSKQYQDMW